MPITILLADDSEVVRCAVRQLLERQADLEVIGEATSFAELNQIADDLKPEIIVTDLYMPDLHSLGPAPRIDTGAARVIAISIFTDAAAEELAANLGAVMLLDKAELYAKLVPTIREASQE